MTVQPGLFAYDHAGPLPRRVRQAVELTRRDQFPQACLPAVGCLLQRLAGLQSVERACELGTAYGVGAAWIESGLNPGASLLTVELDPARAAAARQLFARNPAIEVLTGDWSLALGRAPFDLLFSDGGPKRAPGDPEKLAPLVRPGGMVLLDDYTPAQADGGDVARTIWFESELYRAREVVVTPENSVIIAVRA